MDPFSLIGLIASSVALVGTATNITKGFHDLILHYKDIPQCINDLFHEHKLVEACLQNFQKFLESNQNDPHDDIVVGMRNQAHAAAFETQKTLDELHGKIQRFLPNNQSAIRRATVRIGWKYTWNARSLQAIMHRLQTRRNALSVIMQLWSTNDAAMLRRQIAVLQTTLQDCLRDLRQPSAIDPAEATNNGSAQAQGPDPDATSPTDAQPADDKNEADVDDASSMSSVETNSTTLTMPHGPTAGQRFMDAIAKAHASGPRGDAVQRQLRHVNAVKATAVGESSKSTSDPSIESLVSALIEREIAPSGLCAPESAVALAALAKAYQDIEDYGTALEYYHEALIAREQVLGPAHQTTLNTMGSIASLFELADLWDYALAYWLQYLEGLLESAKFGANHPTTLAARLRLARARSMAGNHEEALSDLAGLLSFYEAASRGSSTDSMAVRREQARVQARQGKHAEALEAYRALLPEYEAIAASRRDSSKFGPQHRRTREAYEAVAELNRDIADAEQEQSAALSPSTPAPATPSDPTSTPPPAEGNNDSMVIRAYHEKLKQVREKKGNLHPDTLELMCDLAGAYASHENYKLAIGWYKEALKGQERALPAGHPVVAATVFHMAECYTELGDLQTALTLFQRVLADREARFSRDHPDTLAAVLAIGSIYTSKEFQDFPQAMRLVKRAVDGFTTKFGPLHNDTLSAKFQMAQIHVQKENYAQGIQLHELVLRQRTTKLGENHHSTHTSKSCLAQAYIRNGDRTKAITLWAEVLIGRERTLGRTHSKTTDIADQLATACWNDEKWQDAIPYFKWVLEGIQHEQPNCEAATLEVLDNIAKCYDMLEDNEQALEWFRKVLAIHERQSEPNHNSTIQAMEHVARICSVTKREPEAISLYHKILAVREETLPDSHRGIAYPLLQLSRCTFSVDQRDECLFWTTRLLAIPEEDIITPELRLVARRRMGLVYLQEKQPEQAYEVYQSLLEDARALLPADHWVVQSATKELRVAHNMSLQQVDAIGDLVRERERVKRLMDTDRPSAIVTLSHIAGVHLKESEYTEAAAMYEEVIDLIEELETRRLLGFDVASDDDDGLNLTVLKHIALSKLADAHVALANHDRALSLLGLLAGSEQDRRFRHGALIRMGNLREEMGEYVQALETWNLLLGEIRQEGGRGDAPARPEETSGPFDELRTMRRIAVLHLHMGDPAEALRWGNGILKGFRNLAAESPASPTAAGKRPAGETDSDGGDADEDDEEDTPLLQVFRTLDFLATVNWSLGNYEEGIAAGKEAAEGFERQRGATHKLALDAALSLAEMYAMLERKPQALAWYKKVLTGYETKVSSQHPQMQDGESRRVAELAKQLGVSQRAQ